MAVGRVGVDCHASFRERQAVLAVAPAAASEWLADRDGPHRICGGQAEEAILHGNYPVTKSTTCRLLLPPCLRLRLVKIDFTCTNGHITIHSIGNLATGGWSTMEAVTR